MRYRAKSPRLARSIRQGNRTPSTHKGDGPWKRGYDPTRDKPCGAKTVRDPEATDWSPEQPDTVVPAECIQPSEHRGWHVATDGYAWDPDDDTNHVVLTPTT